MFFRHALSKHRHSFNTEDRVKILELFDNKKKKIFDKKKL